MLATGASIVSVAATTAMPTIARAQATKADVVVEMNDALEFTPGKINIKVGDTVEWRNVEKFPHSVTADPRKARDPNNVELPDGAEPFGSLAIWAGQTFQHTFKTPGVYRYFCIPHEQAGMLGTVIVG